MKIFIRLLRKLFNICALFILGMVVGMALPCLLIIGAEKVSLQLGWLQSWGVYWVGFGITLSLVGLTGYIYSRYLKSCSGYLQSASNSNIDKTSLAARNQKVTRFVINIGAGAVMGFFMAVMLDGVFVSMAVIKGLETKMQRPEVYKPVAIALATYCQSDLDLFPGDIESTWQPQELRNLLEGSYCSVSRDDANVGFGGGFYHFGYCLSRDKETSTRETNVWDMSLYREDSADQPLFTFSIPTSKHMDASAIEKMVGLALDRSIAEDKKNAYLQKIFFQLKFGHAQEAATTCAQWVKSKPEFWLPHFVLAHILCRLGESESGALQFTEWTLSHKNFEHFVILGMFNYREGRTNEAIQALSEALKQPYVEASDDDGDITTLGDNGALIAYSLGDYIRSLLVCDKMLAHRTKDPWGHLYVGRTEQRIKAAALYMKGDETEAKALMKQIIEDGKLDNVVLEDVVESDEKLLKAMDEHDIKYITEIRNWVSGSVQWFSPNQFNNVMYSSVLVPQLYPASWEGDLIRFKQQGDN